MDFPQAPAIPENCLSCEVVCARIELGETMKDDIQLFSERMDAADDSAINVVVQVHDALSLPDDIYNGVLDDLGDVMGVIEEHPESQRLTLLEFLQEYRTEENSELGVLAFTPLMTNIPEIKSMPLRAGVEAALRGARLMRTAFEESEPRSQALKDGALELIDAGSDARDGARQGIEQMKTGLVRNYQKIQLVTENCAGATDKKKGMLKRTVVKQCGTTATRQMLTDV